MLVDFFFFNPFPYLLLTPPLNLKALYSANWKSSLFSLPFSYLIYGAGGVGEKCPTHWPLPLPLLLCIKILYPFLPFHFFSLLFWQKGAFSSLTLRTYCTGEAAPPAHVPTLVSLVLSALLLVLFFLVGCG